MIERQRRQNDPETAPVHRRTVRVSSDFMNVFQAWLDLQIAQYNGWAMTAEMKVVSRMKQVAIDGWPEVFLYTRTGPTPNSWGKDSYEFAIYSTEFDSDIEDWRPEFTKRDGMKQ